jgi:leucyl-tRNA synthetase
MMAGRQVQDKSAVEFKAIERKWRSQWAAIDLYKTGDDPAKPNYYILDYFPYPSGDGLSVGHCRNYVPTCVDARYMRMKGFNVLHPMGWDAFGLPAENYAIEHDIHPRKSTELFCDTYRRQMKLVECSYDWSREINSTHPEFYRWTQWFFLLMFEQGLAYRASGSQWWCPKDQTILANEQVENGRCWRCDTLVEKKDLPQWHLRITDYAERLLSDLDDIEWPDSIKTMQRNWIGRSEGAEITFQTDDADRSHKIRVFTTRPDTLYGATFLVLAPEHPLVSEVTSKEQSELVRGYVASAARKGEIERMSSAEDKSGVFTGGHAVHPLSGDKLPIWIAEYVLMEYGTGSIMGVPAHDERDLAFAQRHRLPVKPVIAPMTDENGEPDCYTGHGRMINSGAYTGLASQDGGERIVRELASRSTGKKKVTYKMRDWLISRQRYWGAPIPIVHCPACGIVPVDTEQLPVLLPDTTDFAPLGDGRSPLARVESWVRTTCPNCDGPAERETDTMDGFACSSWYFLRFTSPRYDAGPFDPEEVKRWMPVDTYVGGAEHAVMHLLYARFWSKVLYDAGLIPFSEPFTQLRNQGMLHSAVDGQKMSKSKGNVVTPDEVIARHGTDALRAYVLFLGPFDADVVWDERGIKGIIRFLERYWNLALKICAGGNKESDEKRYSRAFERKRHQMIRRISAQMEGFRFNTAIAALMEYLNYLLTVDAKQVGSTQWREALETLTLLMSPIVPFISEEVWQELLGHAESVHRQTWPQFDQATAQDEQITVIVQVNGRLRDKLVMPAGAEDSKLREAAVSSPRVKRHVGDKEIRKVIVVPEKLVNIVI